MGGQGIRGGVKSRWYRTKKQDVFYGLSKDLNKRLRIVFSKIPSLDKRLDDTIINRPNKTFEKVVEIRLKGKIKRSNSFEVFLNRKIDRTKTP